MLPGPKSGARKKSSNQTLLFALLLFLIFATVLMLVFLPGVKDEPPVVVKDVQFPGVRPEDGPARQNSATAAGDDQRFAQFEQRMELLLQRITEKEQHIEAMLKDSVVVRNGHDVVVSEQHKPAAPEVQNPYVDRANTKHVSSNKESHGGKKVQKTVYEDRAKMDAVKEAMKHAWSNYKTYAWGLDELQPLTKTGNNWIGLGATIVDALDTLWIMGMHEEFYEARDWIRDHLNFARAGAVSFFETTIRALGGLLSAYGLSRDPVFLDKAEDLGQRLLKAFNTPHGIPHASVNLNTGTASNPGWIHGRSVLSEMGTVQLEFTYLARLTGKPEYAVPALEVFKHLDKIAKPTDTFGLHSLYVNLQSGEFSGSKWSLGALGDSFYEYLLKMYLLTGAPGYRRMYDESSDAMHKSVIQRSTPSGLTYVAEVEYGKYNHKMDHLVCFAGAMFALGANGTTYERDFHTGEEITRTCFEMYDRMATGIAPEIVNFVDGKDFVPGTRATHYLLRPETVESIFVMYRLTGDQRYRAMGWKIFEAIEKYCRVEHGYSGIRDVTSTSPVHDNQQQSFFLAETLKYLYLLFTSSDVISLDEYIFNTECHVIPKIHGGWEEYAPHFPHP